MEIEIITAKKKLTKSIVSQIQEATTEKLKDCKVLGYLINAKKNCHKVILLKKENLYFIIPNNYTKYTQSVSRCFGKWSIQKEFKSEERCNEFWKYYSIVLEKATNQIFI